MSPGSFKNVFYKIYLKIIYLIYMYKQDLALNNQQRLICYKSLSNQTKPQTQTHTQRTKLHHTLTTTNIHTNYPKIYLWYLRLKEKEAEQNEKK